jgi:hypothetical protein
MLADYEDFKMDPRIINSLKEHPNYIIQNKKFLYMDREIEFSFEDYRESHGTSTKIIGLDKGINIYGYGILFKSGKILLEVWNDKELNCWSEYDINQKEPIFIKLEELEPYLTYYVPEKHIKDNYLQEIKSDFSTEALSVCHYYFKSDQESDEKMLQNVIGNLADPEEQWKILRKVVNKYYQQNNRDVTWRAICVMKKSNEIYFKGTSIEPLILSEVHLFGNTVLSWGGKTQLQWMAIAKKYLPIYRILYEITNEKDRERESWKIITYQILTNLVFSHLSITDSGPDFEEYSQIINIAKRGDDKDKLIVKTALIWLLKKRRVNMKVRADLKNHPFLK